MAKGNVKKFRMEERADRKGHMRRKPKHFVKKSAQVSLDEDDFGWF